MKIIYIMFIHGFLLNACRFQDTTQERIQISDKRISKSIVNEIEMFSAKYHGYYLFPIEDRRYTYTNYPDISKTYQIFTKDRKSIDIVLDEQGLSVKNKTVIDELNNLITSCMDYGIQAFDFRSASFEVEITEPALKYNKLNNLINEGENKYILGKCSENKIKIKTNLCIW